MMHYWWYHKSIGLENWTMIIIFSSLHCLKKLTHQSNLRCSAFCVSAIAFKENLTNHVKRQTERKYILLLFAPFQKLWFTLTMFQNHIKKVSFCKVFLHQKSSRESKKSTIAFFFFFLSFLKWNSNNICKTNLGKQFCYENQMSDLFSFRKLWLRALRV